MSVVNELIEDTDNVHISDGVSRHVSRLETVLRHGFSCLGLGSVSTLVYLVLALSRTFMFRRVSRLMAVSL